MYEDCRNVKTPATVLQEMMTKKGLIPEYKCVGQSGLQHQSTFEYVCAAAGVVARGVARSKKDAKQAAARRALAQLAARGDSVPPPYNAPVDADVEEHAATSSGAGAGVSHVALLKELCEEYGLGAVEYPLLADTGPPHNRHFTIAAEVGQRRFLATANSKKAARQAAAEKLYTYLRENLARLTKDFDESEALVRAHEKAMERYVEVTSRDPRPQLGLKIADYHLALRRHAGTRADAALRALDGGIDQALRAMELPDLDADMLNDLRVLRLPWPGPALSFASENNPEEVAKEYLRLALSMKLPAGEEEKEIAESTAEILKA